MVHDDTTAAQAAPAARPAWVEAAAVVAGLTAVLATLFIAFGLPAVKSGPHKVPLGVVGPAETVTQAQQGLDQGSPGAFKIRGYPDEQALRNAILDRKVYGGLVAGQQGLTVFTASAASAPVAQLVTNLANNATQGGIPVTTEDLAPLPAKDPRGGGLTAAALPLTIGGLIPAVALLRRFRNQPWLRVAAASAFALAAGLALAAILKFWFGTVTGNYWLIALGLALGIAAISLALLGLGSVAGWVGLALGAAFILLLGNPLSGLAAGPEFLPSGWGAFGQLLPPGANGSLLRSTGFFEGAGATKPILVLAGWALAGLALTTLAALRDRSPATVPDDAEAAEAASPGDLEVIADDTP